MVDIVVAGHLCLDLIPRMSNVPLDGIASPGKLFEISSMDVSTGGAVSNTGLALHVLGVDVGLMGKIGDDIIGRVTIASLKDRDPKLADLVKIQSNTAGAYTIVLSPAQTDRIFLHCAGPNVTFGTDDIDFELVRQAKVFHLGYPPILPNLIQDDGAQLSAIYERVKGMGLVTSLDTSLPDMSGVSGGANWERILAGTLPYVDIFLPSIEEILVMIRRADYEMWSGNVMAHISRSYLDTLAEELLDMGAGVVGFKLGEYGIYARASNKPERLQSLMTLPVKLSEWTGKRAYHPAFAADVQGTTGAGDSAFGGFLASLLHGYSLEDAVQMACAVGSCNVEAPDATSGVRSWGDTRTRIDSGWQLITERLPD